MANGAAAPPGPMLRGRRRESAVLEGLLDGARAGRSGALVVRGDAGVGKTALLEYVIASAPDLGVVRAVGVESERELAFAALHQLCVPILDRLERLPGPQRGALQVTFGLSEGPVPDRFLVGLALLGLLAEAAQERALVCAVDDAQWLDAASARALAFVARRLLAESVLLLFAARQPSDELLGLPALAVGGLKEADARELLRSVVPGRLDERIREQVIAEARGNPLALLELTRGLSPAQLAGGFGLPGALSLEGRIQQSFLARVDALPEGSRRLLLVAAAEPTGDPALVWRAARRLGITATALGPAESAGLLEVGARVRFRHPLVRSAVYLAASPVERRDARRVLAEATDAAVDPDRRAWHLAEAAPGPDEEVAAELERAAGRAQARGGVAAAAAFLERAVGLTSEPERRGGGGPGGGPGARWRPRERISKPARSMRRSRCWRRWRRGRGTSSSMQASTSCVGRSRSPQAPAPTLQRCSLRRQGSSNRSIPRWRVSPIWTPGSRHCSPGSSRVPAMCMRFPASLCQPPNRHPLRARPICYWTAFPSWSPKDASPRRQC